MLQRRIVAHANNERGGGYDSFLPDVSRGGLERKARIKREASINFGERDEAYSRHHPCYEQAVSVVGQHLYWVGKAKGFRF